MKKENIFVLRYTPQLDVLYTLIRDKNTTRKDFIFYSDRIIRLLVEEALNFLPVNKKKVITPTAAGFLGAQLDVKICAVSIIRAGESMEKGFREVCEDVSIGKILIQRNEKTVEPILFYSKLPEDISSRYVFLLDPMLATGGSVCKAIGVLKEKGVNENKIIFINLVACPEGLKRLTKEFPKVQIVTGFIDKKLN